MALIPIQDSAESNAFRDWDEPQRHEVPAAEPQPPRKLTAAITDVLPVAASSSEDEEASVIFAEFEQRADEAPSIEPVGHASKPKVPVAPSRKANSVWLTGTIEDEETAGKK